MNDFWNPEKERCEPEPFEFPYLLTDKTGEEIDVTISGFWIRDLQEMDGLTILDGLKKDVTNLFNDRETRAEIEDQYTCVYLRM